MLRLRLFIYSLLLCVFFLTSLSEKSNAQNPVFDFLTEDIEYGINLGTNVSSHINSLRFYTGNTVLDISPRTSLGLSGGFILRKSLNESIRFQAEPTFIGLGAKYNDNFQYREFNYEVDGKTNLIYFHLPLLFQWSTTPSSRQEMTIYGRKQAETTYHFTGGLFWGYLLGATFSGSHDGPPEPIQLGRNFSENMSDHFYGNDGGLIVGGGFERGLDTKFGMELRAFSSLFDTGKTWSGLNFDPKHLGVSVVFYVVGL